MQIRFLVDELFAVECFDAKGKFTGKKTYHSGISDIVNIKKIVFENPLREWADIYLTDREIIKDVAGEVFEPCGFEVEFKSTEIPKEPSDDIPVPDVEITLAKITEGYPKLEKLNENG